MKNEQIEDLLLRHLRGSTSPEEGDAARRWLTQHMADPRYDDMFTRLLDAAGMPPQRSVERVQQRLEAFLRSAPARPARRPWRITLRVAQYAAVAAAVAVAVVMYLSPAPQAEWKEVYAASGETRRVELPDGTRIWLNSGSRVIYPERFEGRTRRIHIDGHVYADVAKDARHPFVASAPGLEVRVLGTQFSMKSYAEDPHVEVALIEGSVAMSAGEGQQALNHTLTPGNMVRYRRADGMTEHYRLDSDAYVSWHHRRDMCFVNQTLDDIAADLERRFDVKIIIESERLASTHYYASFINDESLDQILRALNGNDAMHIAQINGTIIISPKNKTTNAMRK